MLRKFELRDAYYDNRLMGYIVYDTETKEFRIFAMKPEDYEGTPGDPSLEVSAYKVAENREVEPFLARMFIRDRIMPPNRTLCAYSLHLAGIPEYDEMAILDFTGGKCARDERYFKEIFDIESDNIDEVIKVITDRVNRYDAKVDIAMSRKGKHRRRHIPDESVNFKTVNKHG